MTKRPAKQTAAMHREVINRSGALHFLIDIVQGKPQPVRDQAGRIIDWTEPAELGQRISAAQHLTNKVIPNLQAQQLDITSDNQQTLRIVMDPNLVPQGNMKTVEQIEGGKTFSTLDDAQSEADDFFADAKNEPDGFLSDDKNEPEADTLTSDDTPVVRRRRK